MMQTHQWHTALTDHLENFANITIKTSNDQSSYHQERKCSVCVNLGKPSNHKIEECKFLSFADQRRLARTFQLTIDDSELEAGPNGEEGENGSPNPE